MSTQLIVVIRGMYEALGEIWREPPIWLTALIIPAAFVLYIIAAFFYESAPLLCWGVFPIVGVGIFLLSRLEASSERNNAIVWAVVAIAIVVLALWPRREVLPTLPPRRSAPALGRILSALNHPYIGYKVLLLRYPVIPMAQFRGERFN